MSKEPWLGIAYWVEWERPGAAPIRIADPSRFVFRSGDRIRFHVKTNVPGYLYVMNRGPVAEIPCSSHLRGCLIDSIGWRAKKSMRYPARLDHVRQPAW